MDAATDLNARRDRVIRAAGCTPLTQPPAVGETVLHLSLPDCRLSMRSVSAVRDHRPVDGTPTKNAIVEFVGGDWDFYWNLYEGD